MSKASAIQGEGRENAAEKPVKQPVTPGWIYEGATQDSPYPGAKYYLKRYNYATTNYDYISNLTPPFSADSIRQMFGAGSYRIEPRLNGQFQTSETFSVLKSDGKSHRENNNDNHGSDNGRDEVARYSGMSGSERIKHVMADAMEFKMVSEYLGINKKEVGDNTMNDLVKAYFIKQFDRNPIEELSKSFTQLQGLSNLFGKNHGAGNNGKYIFESALAECIPDIMSIVKQKITTPGIIAATRADNNNNGKKEEDNMNDIQYLIQKLYAMAKNNQPVDEGVALALLVLTEKDVNKLLSATPELLIENIVADYPQMKKFLESEEGKLWITNFLTRLQTVISSRKEKPAQEKKSNSSGDSSNTDGTTQKSSGPQKTSSDSSEPGTTQPKPGQSTNG